MKRYGTTSQLSAARGSSGLVGSGQPLGAQRLHRHRADKEPTMHAVFLLAATTTATTNSNSTGLDVNPADGSGLPGEGTLSDLASGLGHWALLAAIVGVILGGVLWAFGHFSHNYQQSYNGRKGVIVSGVAALLIGASQELISFFFSAGLKLH